MGVSYQGVATVLRGNNLKFFITMFDGFMIVWMNLENRWGHDCVRPSGRYGPKGGTPCI